MRTSSIIAIALAASWMTLVPAPRIAAQSVSVGVGVYGGPRHLPPFPYFGVYPLHYPGFYGNGMSMYGPPVPTYGPIPGTFGASDHRVNQNGPAIGFPIGIYATYSRPRPLPLLDDVALRPDPNTLLVEVRVPLENAIVFINDQVTKQNGEVRFFSSPPLRNGNRYQYTVRAVWTIDGQRNDRTLTITGNPGERVIADFVK